jgi:predicted glycosyltransferase
MVGEPLVRAAVEVHRDLFIRTGLCTTVVAGPFLPDPVWAWLRDQAARSPVLEAVRRVDDLAAEIARSALSLSQGGYNTTMDLLRAGTPAVVVPFADGGENEQTVRTARLARLGALRMVPATALGDRERLLAALVAAAAAEPAPVRLDLSGAERTARILADVPTALEAVR